MCMCVCVFVLVFSVDLSGCITAAEAMDHLLYIIVAGFCYILLLYYILLIYTNLNIVDE